MEHVLATTPFGRRPLSLAMRQAQQTAKNCPPDAAAHKWRVWRSLAEAKDRLGLSDRPLAVLNALLSFHQETALTASSDLVVFPSNRELSIRAHGMPASTLRRHLATLVETGLVIRRDSPNGKRYARKGQGGQIEQAFGFDLSPLVARAAEFERVAEEVKADRRGCKLLREQISILRRDTEKSIEAGVEEGLDGPWPDLVARLAGISRSVPRSMEKAPLEASVADLRALMEEVAKRLEEGAKLQNMSANESQTERHIQNSNADHFNESEPDFQESRAAAPASPEPPRRRTRSFPLPMVLNACPDIIDWAKQGISSWRDLMATAGNVRSALGISPSAWEDACAVLGEEDAAVVIAAILQRADAIKSAGGYLRSLTEKARAGQFSLGPVLMALLRSRSQERGRVA